MHHTADSTVSGDDADTHQIYVEELDGLFFSDRDEKARYRAAALIYVRQGKAFICSAFEIYTFDDGSSIATDIRAEGDGDATGSYTGTINILSGTGRFSSIQGSGGFTGWSNGYNAYHDIELEYSD